MTKAKEPTEIDQHVGQRIRMGRLMVGLSQEELGVQLGISFQQIQKYEKGINRIGAGRLYQISQILGLPVSFLYDGLPGHKHQSKEYTLPKYLIELMRSVRGQRLVEALGRVSDNNIRDNLVRLVQSMAEGRRPVLKQVKRRQGRSNFHTPSNGSSEDAPV